MKKRLLVCTFVLLIGFSVTVITIGADCWCCYCEGYFCTQVPQGGSGYRHCGEYHGPYGDLC